MLVSFTLALVQAALRDLFPIVKQNHTISYDPRFLCIFFFSVFSLIHHRGTNMLGYIIRGTFFEEYMQILYL